MTIWADWSEVNDRINLVFSADTGEFTKVMDMDVTLAEVAKYLSEAESGDDAAVPVMGDARPSCSRVSLVGVHIGRPRRYHSGLFLRADDEADILRRRS
jgi:hypothetical protein